MLDFENRGLGFDTLMVHAGTEADPVTHAIVQPIIQTTAYTFDSVDQIGRAHV